MSITTADKGGCAHARKGKREKIFRQDWGITEHYLLLAAAKPRTTKSNTCYRTTRLVHEVSTKFTCQNTQAPCTKKTQHCSFATNRTTPVDRAVAAMTCIYMYVHSNAMRAEKNNQEKKHRGPLLPLESEEKTKTQITRGNSFATRFQSLVTVKFLHNGHRV